MCSGRDLQIDGAETERTRDEKVLVMLYGLARRFMLEECEGSERLVQRGREIGLYEVFSW